MSRETTSSSSTRRRPPGPSGSFPSRTPPSASLPSSSTSLMPSPGPSSAGGLADARFHRAVDIVQTLPKSGPVNTTYEEKLMLYSLYKQATEGPVTTARPKLLDFLGRAKWDAWKAREGLTRQQAQEAYVDTLLGILKGFSDRPMARELLDELRNFGRSGTTDRNARRTEQNLEYASTTSSQRSLSPPPETTTSRHSYHSALHTHPSLPDVPTHRPLTGQDDDDLTPRRPGGRRYVREFAAGADESRLVHAPLSSDDNRDDEDEEDDYSDVEHDDDRRREEEEESGSQTISDVSDTQGHGPNPRTRSAGPNIPGSRGQHLPPSSSSHASTSSTPRFSGPSPYQHPAQYPAPVQAQLPPHLPSAAPLSSPVVPPPTRLGSQSRLPGRQNRPLRARDETGQISRSTPDLSAAQQQRQQSQAVTVDRALDSIQTSLAALHERLNLMEQTQAALQASNDPRSTGRGWLSRSPVFQLLRLIWNRLLETIHLRRPQIGTARRNGVASLLGRALLSLLMGVRDLSRDAIALVFLVAAIASLRSARGDWRAVIRAWARILALATGLSGLRETGWLLGNSE